MKTSRGLIFLLSAVLAAPALRAAQPAPERTQRSAAAALLALGSLEAGAPAPVASSVADQIQAHRQRLAADAALRRSVFEKSFRDAFGRAPTADEARAGAAETRTYSEWLRAHLDRLTAERAAYAEVLGRAYRKVVRRDPYSLELEYWNRHDAVPYSLLLGCVENWARRNQPGLMVTSGTPTLSIHSEHLTTAWLSVAVAEEARLAAGLATPGETTFAPAYGRNVISPGAGAIVTDGHMCFVAAGAP